MKKFTVLLVLTIICCNVSKAQYVNLPDTNFRNYLRYVYPTCFNAGGQLDTTCNEVVNEDSLIYYWTSYGPKNLEGLQYFKHLVYLNIYGCYSDTIPMFPNSLLEINCSNNNLRHLPALPAGLQILNCSGCYQLIDFPLLPASLKWLSAGNCNNLINIPNLSSSLQWLDVSGCYNLRTIPDATATNLEYLNCNNSSVAPLPLLPNTLKKLLCFSIYPLSNLPDLPESLDSLDCSQCNITQLPVLPPNLTYLNCSDNPIHSFPAFPNTIQYLDCNWLNQNYNPYDTILIDLPSLPLNLKYFYCNYSKIRAIPTLPDGLITLSTRMNPIGSLSAIPSSLLNLDCYGCNLHTLPVLPNSLRYLDCGGNPLHAILSFPDSVRTIYCYGDSLTSLPALPSQLNLLYCVDNQLTAIPALPAVLTSLECRSNQLTSLPNLNGFLRRLTCENNQLTFLPELPNSLIELSCSWNNFYCLPKLPNTGNGFSLWIDPYHVKCLPNIPQYFSIMIDDTAWWGGPHIYTLPLCNPTNNAYNCQSFPVMQGTVFYDNNNNGIKDAGEPVKNNLRVTLSNGSYSFSNNTGHYEIGADSIGSYNLTAAAPAYFSYSPASFNYNFTSYDTLLTGNFALQANTVIDELTVRITPINWAARPGFSFPYLISYENTGTTTLSPNIIFDYDQSKLNYNTSSVSGVVDNSNELRYTSGNLAPGESGSFTGYFTLKTTVPLGDTINAKAIISANSFTAHDSVQTIVRGAFDPNDKQATPQLSPSQVAAGKYIDYTIRFQNTGTDTAFNIVISDTLNEDLQAGSLEMLASSHTCKATVKDNIVFFEMLNIQLPDSNVNESKSHGFVSFRIKPQSNVTPNTVIPNKAAIFFDYNAPVITNTAGTLIKDFTVVPLRMVSFSAVPQTDNTTSLHWNTANEINTKNFMIEQSTDGIRFNSILTVMAKGNASNNYNAVIAEFNSGVIYYRLKIVDNNGSFTYSPIIKIDRRKNAAGFSILTNPVNDFIVINTTDRALNNTSCSIISSQGAVVKIFIIREGSQTVNVNGLSNGIYYLRTARGSSRIIIH